ncbi:hypothetical protein ABPG74_000849 [Tetrahymena malaccensis]
MKAVKSILVILTVQYMIVCQKQDVYECYQVCKAPHDDCIQGKTKLQSGVLCQPQLELCLNHCFHPEQNSDLNISKECKNLCKKDFFVCNIQCKDQSCDKQCIENLKHCMNYECS